MLVQKIAKILVHYYSSSTTSWDITLVPLAASRILQVSTN